MKRLRLLSILAIGLMAAVSCQKTQQDGIRTARLQIKMTSGATANLTIEQRAGLPTGFNADDSPSINKAFEQDWSSAMNIQLVTSVETVNGRVNVKTENTPLPWNTKDPGRKSNLPDEELERMMLNKDDWSLAFNITGIEQPSCVHLNYFGLYNSQTAILRIFFYWPASLIPESGANDHLWWVRFKGNQAMHNNTQYAIPYNHKLNTGAKGYQEFANRAGLYYTTPYANNAGLNSTVVPKIGWWAFDVELSSMQADSFFDDYQQITIGMDLFDQENVILSSVLQGSLNGKLDGSPSLEGKLQGGPYEGFSLGAEDSFYASWKARLGNELPGGYAQICDCLTLVADAASRVESGSSTSIREAQTMIEKAEPNYRKLLVVLETCYSGSIGETCEGLPGVLFLCSAMAGETSMADVYESSIGTYLSNGFTRAFREAITANPAITLYDLYVNLAKKTTGSHACIYNGLYYGSVYRNTFEEYLAL